MPLWLSCCFPTHVSCRGSRKLTVFSGVEWTVGRWMMIHFKFFIPSVTGSTKVPKSFTSTLDQANSDLGYAFVIRIRNVTPVTCLSQDVAFLTVWRWRGGRAHPRCHAGPTSPPPPEGQVDAAAAFLGGGELDRRQPVFFSRGGGTTPWSRSGAGG
ncbi:hypothetical protein B296_00049417, partial [Ensete ventricosum]